MAARRAGPLWPPTACSRTRPGAAAYPHKADHIDGAWGGRNSAAEKGTLLGRKRRHCPSIANRTYAPLYDGRNLLATVLMSAAVMLLTWKSLLEQPCRTRSCM